MFYNEEIFLKEIEVIICNYKGVLDLLFLNGYVLVEVFLSLERGVDDEDIRLIEILSEEWDSECSEIFFS